MKRRPLTRAALIARLPRSFRPKLLPEQIRDLSLAHYANLDAVHSGEASAEILWQMVGGILTWMRITEQLQRGVDEMLEQHELVLQIVARFVRTGDVTFAPGEYEVARRGVEVMDALAKLVDRPTAIAAAEISELLVRQMELRAKEAA